MLNEESVAQLKEENAAMVQGRKLYKQEELEDPERAAGPRLSYQEVIHRLQKCNPEIIVKDGTPGHVALYAMVLNEDGKRELGYVGGFPKESIPEYAYLTLDDHGLPKREVRGWRSILITLIKAQAITYRAAVKYFGEAMGQRSWRWHEQLIKFKEK